MATGRYVILEPVTYVDANGVVVHVKRPSAAAVELDDKVGKALGAKVKRVGAAGDGDGADEKADDKKADDDDKKADAKPAAKTADPAGHTPKP